MNIEDNPLPIPVEVPFMVLPEVTLFPRTLLPLRIFEPRYRAMLAWCLEHERSFAVAMCKPGPGDSDFHTVAGLGFIRACVARPDGTSDLVLQGISRVRFEERLQSKPFPVARWFPMHDQPLGAGLPPDITRELLEICSQLAPTGEGIGNPLQEQLEDVSEPSVLADVITQALIRSAQQRQTLLETLDVGARLQLLLRYLQAQMS